jgi:hypothetical protein
MSRRRVVTSLAAGSVLIAAGSQIAVSTNVRAGRFDRGEAETHGSRFGITVASVLAAVGFAMSVYLLSRG